MNVEGRRVAASFAVWNTGEADWDIMDVLLRRIDSHKWGMLLDDGSFEAAFREFIGEVRDLEVADSDTR